MDRFEDKYTSPYEPSHYARSHYNPDRYKNDYASPYDPSPYARSQHNPFAPQANPFIPQAHPFDANGPTYIKVHRRFLDPDTLAHFNLPWEYDTEDPEYYIIFKDMPLEETSELLRHTKRLRELRKGGKKAKYGNDKYCDEDEYIEIGRRPYTSDTRDEYAWERRERSRADYRRTPDIASMFER
jgi:hypothetical protein